MTTKVGLAKSLRSLKWFEDVDTDTFFPRSYDLNDHDEVGAFVQDFCVVAAQAVLSEYATSGADMKGPRGRGVPEEGGYRRLVKLAVHVCEGYVAKCTVACLEEEEETGSDKDEMRLTAEEWSMLLGEDCPVAAAWLVKGEFVAELDADGDGCEYFQCGISPRFLVSISRLFLW